jgi:hypothetical protein
LLTAHEDARKHGQPLLTEAGVCYLRQRLLLFEQSEQGTEADGNGALPDTHFLPFWDAATRQLWLGSSLLKKFIQPAPNQTKILDTFQEQGWAQSHLDDPLSPLAGESDEDARRRLHETIKNLNRGMPSGTIRFHGDGTGQGVNWVFDG